MFNQSSLTATTSDKLSLRVRRPILAAIVLSLAPFAFANGAELDLDNPSENATVNLIRLLVDRGVLTHEDAVGLIRQAEQDARVARAQATAVREAADRIAAMAEEEATPQEDDIRVTYIPETVRERMVDDVRQEVMAQAREENWAAPRTFPEWTSRLRPFGDVRVRYEHVGFPSGNANTGAFPNFNAINTGAPFDISGAIFSPQWNVDEDRERFRLRARLGLEADLGEGFTIGTRVATGDSRSPVSTNQTLGSPGNFGKYDLWLDQAFLRWERITDAESRYAITAGRFPNPFFSSQIVWDNDVSFDGLAVEGVIGLSERFSPFFAAGAFPVFNTPLNFPDTSPSKYESQDKYLFAAQIGTNAQLSKRAHLKVATAYYHFENIEGALSDPYVPQHPNDAGSTDWRRPSFAQKGNTYMPLRSILPDPSNEYGTINQWQYFGLATPFRPLALTGKLDLTHYEPITISLHGEVVKNLAFDRGDIDAVAVNNRGPTGEGGEPGRYEGGDMAWLAGVVVGRPIFEKRWDWQAGLNYRYVEADAFVDAFVDSDFGLGGTNLQGFTLHGAVALSRRVRLGLGWMSASEVAGPAFSNDIFQFDVTATY